MQRQQAVTHSTRASTLSAIWVMLIVCFTLLGGAASYLQQDQTNPALAQIERTLSRLHNPPRHDRLLEHQRWLQDVLAAHKKLGASLATLAPDTVQYHLSLAESELVKQLNRVIDNLEDNQPQIITIDTANYLYHLAHANNLMALYLEQQRPFNPLPLLAAAASVIMMTLFYFLAFSPARQRMQQLEREVQNQRSYFNHLETYGDTAQIKLSHRGNILSASPLAETIFQQSQADMENQNIEKLLRHKEGEYCFFALQNGINQPPSLAFEGIRRKAEQHFQCQLTVHPLQEGAEQNFILLIRDTSDAVRAYQQSSQNQKMEALGLLTGGIAHDFNNLLHIIMGNMNLLREDLEDEQDLDKLELLSDALSAARDGNNLTDQLLSFSRKQALHIEVVDIQTALINACKLADRAAGGRVEIEHQLSTQQCLVKLDASQFQNAMLNLAINARDAMPNGGKIRIDSQAIALSEENINHRDLNLTAGPYIEISVSDTGIGMPKTIQKQAFDPFFTTKEAGQGTGMGLSMVYGFVKQSQGDIVIASSLGMGTRVTLYLPTAADKPPGPEKTSPSNDSPRGFGNILIVEDEHRVRKFAAKCLRQLGYSTVETASADQAHQLLVQRDHGFDLLFCDMIMPGELDGIQLAQWVKCNRPELSILMTTGYSSSTHGVGEKLRGQLSNIPILYKPYTKDVLARSIRDVYMKNND